MRRRQRHYGGGVASQPLVGVLGNRVKATFKLHPSVEKSLVLSKSGKPINTKNTEKEKHHS